MSDDLTTPDAITRYLTGITTTDNTKLAKAGEDYVTFIGSDFVLEGKQAGEWLAKTTNGKAIILEIEGSTGSSPANDRKTLQLCRQVQRGRRGALLSRG